MENLSGESSTETGNVRSTTATVCMGLWSGDDGSMRISADEAKGAQNIFVLQRARSEELRVEYRYATPTVKDSN